ncbi:Ankyrin repeat protein [Enhygromyxa salina]|uniref:Ankyrin repeat protein n=2 Tax=Enhygromyxa salina TaxID=215803 RepID=A0A0C1ZTA7_9BACT|nr:Ankyrin repeat protein [Enhygromyxa salina]
MSGDAGAIEQAFDDREPTIGSVGALLWAVACELRTNADDPRVVEVLLRLGAPAEAAWDLQGLRTPLWESADRGLKEVSRVLLEAGADAGWASSERSVLHAAAASGLRDVVDRAIELRGVDALLGGCTPLHAACGTGSPCVVQLLRAGADPCRRVSEGPHAGHTPMRFAVEAGAAEAMDALLEAGVELSDDDGLALLTVTHFPEVFADVAEVLTDRDGGFPPRAPRSGHLAVARRLKAHVTSEVVELAAEVLSEGWSRRVALAVAMKEQERLARLLGERAGEDLDEATQAVLDRALWLAADRGDVAVARSLLEHGADPDATVAIAGGGAEQSALTRAAQHGGLELVGLLLDAGADPDGAAGDLRVWEAQPLFRARGVDVVDRLVGAGARPLAIVSYPDVALELDEPRNATDAALHEDRWVEARALERHGVAATPEFAALALFMAVQNGDREGVDLLLELGAKLDEPPVLGSLRVAARLVSAAELVALPDPSGLRAALTSADADALRLALEGGADPNARLPGFSFEGHVLILEPPLVLAIHEGLDALAAILVAVTRSPARTLHAASCAGLHDTVVATLERGANIDGTDGEGKTPLHLAAAKGHVELVRTLLSRGAAVEVRDHQGRGPLDAVLRACGVAEARAAITKALLEAGAPHTGFDPLTLESATLRALADHDRFGLRGDEGARALDRAIDRGAVSAALALLEAGADPDRPYPKEWPSLYLTPGQRPLELAVAAGNAKLVAALLEAGARVDRCGPLLRRAPDLAMRQQLRRAGVEDRGERRPRRV